MNRPRSEGHSAVDPAPPPPLPPPLPSSGGAGLGWVWILALALLICGGGYFAYARLHKAAADAKPAGPPVREIPVVVAKARSGDLKIYLSGLGSVTALHTVTLHTRVDGELTDVGFTEGQIVKPNDLLATIDPRPFEVQLAQATAQLAKDESLRANAQADLTRYEKAGNSISQQERDNQKALVDQAKAATAIDQAAVANAKLQLAYCRIIAPIGGKIGLRLMDQGNIVHANDPAGLAVITQLAPIAVVFTLPEDDLPRVRKVMAAGAAIAVEAYDRDRSNLLAAGTLTALDSQIDPTSGTIKCKATFPNLDGALYPGVFVNVRVLIETIQNTLLIPAAAVQRSPQSTFVYVVKSSDKKDKEGKPRKIVEMREIELGPIEGDIASVDSGLAADELVVTDGVDKLQQGTEVSTTRPARPPTDRRAATTRAVKASTRGGNDE